MWRVTNSALRDPGVVGDSIIQDKIVIPLICINIGLACDVSNVGEPSKPAVMPPPP